MIEVINVLEKVKDIIKNYEMDLSWSTYESEEKLINDLNLYICKLKENDFSYNEKIKFLFAPTGDLEEIAISSEWGEEYIQLSEIIDKHIK